MEMAAEGAVKDGDRNPDMELAQKLFLLTNKCDGVDLSEIRKSVMERIQQQSALCLLFCLLFSRPCRVRMARTRGAVCCVLCVLCVLCAVCCGLCAVGRV